MPMRRELYPKNWEAISLEIKNAVNWCCEKCGRPCRKRGEFFREFLERVWNPSLEAQYPTYETVEDDELGLIPVEKPGRFVLTVAHLDHDPSNCKRENLRAWCAPCHCRYDMSQINRKRIVALERLGQLRLPGV